MTDNKRSIEELNSNGNLNCSEWEENSIKIGNEEGLKGRSNLLLTEIKNFIQKNYSPKKIKQMSLLDVGCFDGYFSTYLSKLEFKRVIGIEPKKKNIENGIAIRKFLNIKNSSNLEFIHGNIENYKPGDEKFDIVMCLGVMHHVGDHFNFIKKLCSLSKHAVILDTRVIQNESLNVNSAINKSELLDVFYKNKFNINKNKFLSNDLFSFSIFKYETAFNDSSTVNSGVVSVPSKHLVRMLFKNFNFNNLNEIISPEKYRNLLNHKRPLDGYLICARKEDFIDIKSKRTVINYENKIRRVQINKDLILSLYNNVVLNKKKYYNLKIYFDTMMIRFGFNKIYFMFNQKQDPAIKEIINNFKYSYHDKITYEYARLLFSEKKYSEAENFFLYIVQKLNSDFRTVYRSFYFLYKIAKINKDLSKQKKYFSYYLKCFHGKN